MAKEVEGQKGDESGQKGRAKHRSPNYPLFDLKKAVERVRQLHERDKTFKVPIGVVHERWGYKKHSAAGNQAVAAMKAYGFVTVEGSGEKRMIAVSDAGRRLVLDAPDRVEILKKAAVGPSLFNSLWTKYRETGIPLNDVLKHELLFERNFNEDIVDDVIQRFRDTVAYSGLEAGDKIEGGGEDDEDESHVDDPPENDKPENPPPAKIRRKMSTGSKEDVFTLSSGDAVLQWPERITPDEYEDLEGWLQLMLRKLKRSVVAGQSDDDGETPK